MTLSYKTNQGSSILMDCCDHQLLLPSLSLHLGKCVWPSHGFALPCLPCQALFALLCIAYPCVPSWLLLQSFVMLPGCNLNDTHAHSTYLNCMMWPWYHCVDICRVSKAALCVYRVIKGVQHKRFLHLCTHRLIRSVQHKARCQAGLPPALLF